MRGLLLGVGVVSSASFGVLAAAPARSIHAVTWNIAAVNNNPFEYWIEHDDAKYLKLMAGVEKFMKDPAEDVPVGSIFPDAKFAELQALTLEAFPSQEQEIKQVEKSFWPALKQKRIVSGFLQDAEIGKKRFASMPDRLTNTITLPGAKDGQQPKTLFRPTPINCCDVHFASFDHWWAEWKRFMFAPDLLDSGKKVASLLKRIPRAKYPELTEEDERLSIPIQILSQAVFDAVLVHMLEKVGKDSWQDLRREMCQALNLKKNARIMHILRTAYAEKADIICLQEVGAQFAQQAKLELTDFHVVIPSSAKAQAREQNSVVLLRKSVFTEPTDVSATIDLTKDKAPVDEGDLLVVHATESATGVGFVVASFHGDTDGLATIPVVKAVAAHVQTQAAGTRLVFGLDANSYDRFKPGKQLDVREFNRAFRDLGLTSCWGNAVDPKNFTTFNARTFLQPQLNKAASREEFFAKGDVNPKDFILSFEAHYVFQDTAKDNTGEGRYVEGMVFPTLTFPSDHGVVATRLVDPAECAPAKL